MRCKACNRALNDNEATYKDSEGHFQDLCGTCRGISYNALERDAFRWDVGLTTDGTNYPTNGTGE